MKIVVLTNDNFFSFKVLKRFLVERLPDIKLVVFSSALIGKKGTLASIMWSLKHTGFRHTSFKLFVYGVFRFMKFVCTFLPFIENKYSSFLWVKRNGIKYVLTNNLNRPEIVSLIHSVEPELVISVSTNQIVKKEILELPPKRCINVHCAPLPRYAGMSPYVWALANNEDHSAATIHYMEEGLDEGDIIIQEKVRVVRGESAFSLFRRCCLKASDLLCKIVNNIELGSINFYEQDLSERTYFSWPNRDCIKQLRANGFKLAKMGDFFNAIFKD
jgi:methionyl-tRNA formyltransferase